MHSLRLLTWNCHHGSLNHRLAELAAFAPAIVFLQECKPTESVRLTPPFVAQRVNGTKGIALATLEGLGLFSAYHAFHKLEHGHEAHPTYRHQRNPAKPWHIDFRFVPANWNVVGVEVLDGNEWTTKSDHLPLKVDVQITESTGQR